MHILDSLLAFSAYFFIGVAMVIIFLFIYSKITPHNEWQLIKNNNTAAAPNHRKFTILQGRVGLISEAHQALARFTPAPP